MKLVAAAFCAMVIGLSACSSNNVTVDFDDSYSFSGKRDYAWLDRASAGQQVDDMVDRRVRRSVDANLVERGFRMVPIEQADLVLAYQVSASDHRVYDTYGYGSGRWWADESATTTDRVFTEGLLTVDILDVDRKELIWRATAEETIDPAATPEERDEIVARAVSGMFDGFPPGN